tara:strand:+ start:39 stop:344 length:306 start_codon:yes stop_codon:yes gene_type:complete
MAKAKTVTPHNNWECVPELRQAVDTINELKPLMHEITSTKRAHYLDYMVVEMKWKLLEVLEILDGINTSEEFKTVEANHNWNEDNTDEPAFDFDHYDRYAD